MTPAEFSAKVRKGLGKKPSLSVRQFLGPRLREDFTTIWLRWEWIKDNRFWKWVSEEPWVDLDDGEEWVRVFLYTEEQMKEFADG